MSRSRNTRGWQNKGELFSRRPCGWMVGKFYRKVCAKIERLNDKRLVALLIDQTKAPS